MPDLSIVVPVYNEGKHIAEMLKALGPNIADDTQVIIVYDFDEDDTVPAVKSIRESLPYCIELHKNDLGRGVLNALKSGIAAAKGEYVLVMMADMSDPPEIIPAMLDKGKKEGLDVVCASRFMKGGTHIGGPWLKNTLSKLAGLSLWWFTGIPTHDCTNNFRLYKRGYLSETVIESKGGFEVALELTVKAWKGGWNVGELPSSWKERSAGKSNFKLWKWLPHYLKWYFYALFGRCKSRRTKTECPGGK